jgi:hypothetical protein
MEIKINNKTYVFDDAKSFTSSIQLKDSDRSIYGYGIEVKYQNTNWIQWNKLYSSYGTTIDAIIKLKKVYGGEFRVIPLYKLDNSDFRDFKINQILSNEEEEDKNKPKKEVKIEFYICKEEFDYKFFYTNVKVLKGSIVISYIGNYYLINNPSQKIENLYDFKKYIHNFTDINLENIKYKPHFPKMIKEKLKIN